MAINRFRSLLAALGKRGDTGEPGRPESRPMTPDQQRILESARRYTWYHRIEIADGVFTEPAAGGYPQIWEFLRRALSEVDFRGRSVLDVGCRDGLFSFEAEKRGAASVHAIDNDLSPGARDFLIPHFNSSVRMEELSVYDLDPPRHGPYDLILFFGVLYHLRYPFWGLKKLADVLAVGGLLLIESGMMIDIPETRESPLLFCPVEDSPYERTSCTFFNATGLITTMRSLGFEFQRRETLPNSECRAKRAQLGANRQFLQFRKIEIPPQELGTNIYWDGVHRYHSVETERNLKAGIS